MIAKHEQTVECDVSYGHDKCRGEESCGKHLERANGCLLRQFKSAASITFVYICEDD